MAITRYRFFTDTIGAGLTKVINAVGDYVFLFSNTGAAETIQVSFDDGEYATLPVGTILKNLSGFQKVSIKNTDSGSATFKYAIGQGDIDYKALVIGSTVVTNPSSTAFTTPAAVAGSTTAALLVAANANRREIIISNNGTAGEIVWIGDVNVDAAAGRGIPISNGEKIVLTTQGVIWSDSSTGTPSISYLETTGV